MPIEVKSDIRVFTESEFHTLAHKIIGIVFRIHNEYGRLMQENIYKQAIWRRCEAAGITPAQCEVAIDVAYKDFHKLYYMDLLLSCGLMVEAKTVEQLSNSHYAQALHYLLLAGMQHGLLINLRQNKVELKYVSTTLNIEERRQFGIDETDWHAVNHASKHLQLCFLDIIADWGAFLKTSLYREAVMHFFGGSSVATRKVNIYDGNVLLGTHDMILIDDDTAFELTSISNGKSQMKEHFMKLLSHTNLRFIQWINIHQHIIEFHTLSR